MSEEVTESTDQGTEGEGRTEDQLLDMIATSDGPGFDLEGDSEEESQKDSSESGTAPVEGHPDKDSDADPSKAPSDGLPAKETDSDAGGEKDTANSEGGETGDSEDGEVAPEGSAIDEALAEVAGTEQVEPPGDKVWYGRYSDLRAEHQKHIEHLGNINSCLKEAGVEVQMMSDGSLKTVATGENWGDLNPEDVDLDAVVAKLETEDFEAVLNDDPKALVKKISQEVASQFIAKRPSITGKADDAVLPDNVCGEVWDNFINSFPGAKDQMVQDLLQRLYVVPTEQMATLRKSMESNKHLRELGYELLWHRARRVNEIARAKKTDKETQKEAKTEENKKEVALSGTGSSPSVKGQSTGETGKPDADKILDFIATSDEGADGPFDL